MTTNPHQSDEEPITGSHTSIKVDSYTHESVSVDNVKQTDAFSQITRGIKEDDLQSRGTMQWLLSEHDKYEGCLKQFNELKDRYHERDKDYAIAKSKLQTNTAFEVLYSCSLSMGFALIGAFASFEGNIKWLAIVAGGLIAGGAIMAKLFNISK